MTRKAPVLRIALFAVLAVLVLVPAAFAAKGGGGGHNGSGGGGTSGGTCTQYAPGVVVDNNWDWGMWGSWGLPGQQLRYAVHVLNYDSGCPSSSFVVNVSAPNGFSVSIPTNTISLNSGSSGYVWAYVTSPNVIADGDYPLIVTANRSGTSSPTGTFATYYKAYSSDTVAPILYYPNPWDGATISGSSYGVMVTTSDDHAVKKIDLYIDNVYRTTTLCAGISYECQLSYKWSLSGVKGQHAITFKSYDWIGNVGVKTVSFTVS